MEKENKSFHRFTTVGQGVRMKKTVIVLSLLVFAANSFAADQTEAIKAQTAKKIQTAMALMQRADSVTHRQATKYELSQAVNMYVEAGQLLENAWQVYQKLGPQHVSGQDSASTARALERTIKAAQATKLRLAKAKN